MSNLHQNLAKGSWYKLTLCEQMGNIGSEVSRVMRARDSISRQNAFARALELFDLTVADPARRHQLKEILRAREVFVTEVIEKKKLESLDKYFLHFAVAARIGK